jgi:predicted ATPase
MTKKATEQSQASAEPPAIAEIQVAGFKSISDEQKIEIRPLTILAGANSSGKSSIMQPLLLLKQTLEASYDPGPLLLNGPNVKFTSNEQLLARIGKGRSLDSFQVGMRLNTGDGFVTTFRKEHKAGFRIEEMKFSGADDIFPLWPEMTRAEIIKSGITKSLNVSQVEPEERGGKLKIERVRCFLSLAWGIKPTAGTAVPPENKVGGRLKYPFVPPLLRPPEFLSVEHLAAVWERMIPEVIHLPGLRGNPERAYPVAAVGPTYPGTFEKYTANVIFQWMEEDSENLAALNADLGSLKLTGGIIAKRLFDIQLELYVGRLPDVSPEQPDNQVNIADVGVGVSQTLPVLVALHAAKPGQLVYMEQPETHLHPRAQFALAQVLASAAKRGVRVVAETHSSTLLLGVQTLVAEGSLEPDKVKLHWFQREKNGRTIVKSADLDEAGAFGDWPEDFDEVALQTQARYLDAASAVRLHK